ncbi:hypothetical protein AVEN_266316-1 [Araneus ventricosus]|uniref:Uncharacterized protein n=1 Tax=Araneus ventricosus TaxID=182803 RepID=A0A4Y2PRM5_ARAVE|nr:hypothetical protein AVEN_266316-1 [Araneus ventricosus]
MEGVKFPFYSADATKEPEMRSYDYIASTPLSGVKIVQDGSLESVLLNPYIASKGDADLAKNVGTTGESSVCKCSLVHRDQVRCPSATLASETDGRPPPVYAEHK